MSVFLLVVAAVLLALPGLSLRLSRYVAPQRYVRAAVFSVAAGVVFIEAALALAAVPTVLRAFGLTELASLCERVAGHLVPGGALTGWIAAVSALVVPIFIARGVRKSLRERRLLRDYSDVLGTRVAFAGGTELVVVDAQQSLALALPGEPARIIVSSGLIRSLEPRELRAVVDHEKAHVALRHQRHHLVLTGFAHCFGWMPVFGRSFHAWRFGIERAADERAAGTAAVDRIAVRDAIRKVAAAPVPADLAGLAFSAASLTTERMRMLERAPHGSRVVAAALWLAVAAGVTLASAVLINWIGHTHHLAVVAPFCHL